MMLPIQQTLASGFFRSDLSPTRETFVSLADAHPVQRLDLHSGSPMQRPVDVSTATRHSVIPGNDLLRKGLWFCARYAGGDSDRT